MYSYDKPLHSMVTVPADVATTPIKFPVSATADMSSDKQRTLGNVVILGVVGIVKTVGPMTLEFGDGVTADAYGVFTLDSGVAANGPATGKLVLTEAGYLLGTGAPKSGVITVTGTGTGVLDGGQVIVGYF